MKHRITDRLGRLEAVAIRKQSDTADICDEERYYRLMRLIERGRERRRDGWVNPNPPTPEECRRIVENIESIKPRLKAAENRIKEEAKRMGMSTEEYLRRSFPWVSYSERYRQWQ